MKINTKILTLLCFIVVSTSVFAQKLSLGAYAGGNINFLSIRSDYDIQNESKIKPGISYNFGLTAKSNFRIFDFYGSLEFIRIKNNIEPYNSVNEYNEFNYNMSPSIINQSLIVSFLGTIKIFNVFYIGTGLSENILLNSKFKAGKLNQAYSEKISDSFNNKTYKTFNTSIPAIVGCDFGKIGIFTRFNLGIINRLKGETNVKEYENPLVLCVKYTFYTKP